MGGLFPGAGNIETFWQNILNRVDTSGEVPASRWGIAPDVMYHPQPQADKAYSKRSHLITDFRFDSEGFTIDPHLLAELDPLYHLVLHVGRDAVGGLPPDSLNRRRTGVILAAIALPTETASRVTTRILGSIFEEKLFGAPARDLFNTDPAHPEPAGFSRAAYLSSRVTGLPGAILARALDLGGGSFTLDAACASSIFAIKLACDELQSGRADAMLAGGVSRPDCLFTQVGFSQLRALSPSGRCAPFDESADGLVVGEGAGMLVLKRLADARRDGDPIYGLIHGIGLSNDLGGNLLAPDSEGQVRAMTAAYKSCGWSPHDIDLIECHGAGTPLGDLTELRSLNKLWGDSGWTQNQCAIGSIKSMIGHLLTAAAAAGSIKTLLALHHKTLPPSLNFALAPPDSPLHNGPFRVLTQPEPWRRSQPDRPRRAAISAFGFGGINAHLLLEEWDLNAESGMGMAEQKPAIFIHTSDIEISRETISGSDGSGDASPPHSAFRLPPSDVAITGMATAFGSVNTLREFQELIFNGRSNIRQRPKHRWKGCDRAADQWLGTPSLTGGFCDRVVVAPGEFHIPPKEIPDILPQQSLMLQVAAAAMRDAALTLRQERREMGTVIGIDFDFEAADFCLRWHQYHLIDRQVHELGWHPSDAEKKEWLASLKDACGPPLTATRTLGALGAITASRIAREFRLGGPSFVVSCDAASGLKALDIAVRALQQGEAESYLVGAVDFSGDLRNIILKHGRGGFSRQRQVRPFDQAADGILPGEGAAALILKRLDHAIADHDRIYAVIKGIGAAGGGGIEPDLPTQTAYMRSLSRCCRDAAVAPQAIDFIETHGSGQPAEDNLETEALHAVMENRRIPCAVGSTKPNIGHTGAAAALASVVKTALCLYHEIIPPLASFTKPGSSRWHQHKFHLPRYPQFWQRDRRDGVRQALVGSLTPDGNCMHVLLAGFEYETRNNLQADIIGRAARERQRPLGYQRAGLFTVSGNDRKSLLAGLERLDRHIEGHSAEADGIRRDVDNEALEETARNWYLKNDGHCNDKSALSIAADDRRQLKTLIVEAREAVLAEHPCRLKGTGGIHYSPHPLGKSGELAFVFPGSGNHYLGMGRDIGVHWPQILRDMDSQTLQLRTQLLPEYFVPWRVSWEPGWQKSAHERIISDPLTMIFGQVAHGSVMAGLMAWFAIAPSAVIGYSLGESAANFAMGVWPERGEMLQRMKKTKLFSTELAGPCSAARKAWNLAPEEPVDWCAAVVNRPAPAVRQIVSRFGTARLLIVNTPSECVIGGRRQDVQAAIKELACEAVYLDGVVTVHCDALQPVAEAYRELHVFPTRQPEGIRFYSCARGRALQLTSGNTADSILEQALHGFDFTATVQQAYREGVRIFLEMGPAASCTRMIGSILKDKPHIALSACVRGEDDYTTIIKALAALTAERVPVDLAKLYGNASYAPQMLESTAESPHGRITIRVGGKALSPALPLGYKQQQGLQERKQSPETMCLPAAAGRKSTDVGAPHGGRLQNDRLKEPQTKRAAGAAGMFSDVIVTAADITKATAAVHRRYLDFASDLTRNYGRTFALQTRLLEQAVTRDPNSRLSSNFLIPQSDFRSPTSGFRSPSPPAVYSRDACLEFARGSAANVLGPEFTVVDGYAARVRLPDEPLMLVDRILAVEGAKGTLGPGRIVTEHDVRPQAWYLDGGHAPVCISVEAGQADLFLCAYLGIDLIVKGKRTYRLLDAAVEFHRSLPVPGETVRYDIRIHKFIRQGDTYLFLFSFKGFIGDTPLITMTDGCAGFFTESEVRNSGGIILTGDDTAPSAGKTADGWIPPVAMQIESYDEASLQALRAGDAAACFGDGFQDIVLPDSLRLRGGRMKLIDRILELDPHGGRYGLGRIRAEADIHADDWFLTCHFVDDRVMPGTLMYECCAHTLRVLMQRMGWITDKAGVCYEPVIGVRSVLKCRGPVTPHTRRVVYEVEVKQIGYTPQPYMIADAHMYADGDRIVLFRDMSMQMSGITRDEIDAFWRKKAVNFRRPSTAPEAAAVFDRGRILEFTAGSPARAFGDRYEPFERDRFIARLPCPPFLFIDRIMRVDPDPWKLEPGGWIEAEYDIRPDAWYFRAERSPAAPVSIILEIALQPCGWLAAYMGSALKSEKDLRFRNLGGNATLYQELFADFGTVSLKTRLTKAADAGDMIIEHFDFELWHQDQQLYAGNTYFGFFSTQTLAVQEGIRDADRKRHTLSPADSQRSRDHTFVDRHPLAPSDPETDPPRGLSLPARAIRMIDRIDVCLPDGGPAGLGFIRGSKVIDPREWFFDAHFYQDPVLPGSLGIESFIQLLKYFARLRWPELTAGRRFGLLRGTRHDWTYRGQILPHNRLVTVEAAVTGVTETPVPTITASGYLEVDGLCIYQLDNFGIELVER